MIDFLEMTAAVKNGEQEALTTYIALKRQLKAIESALDEIQPLAVEEAEKYPEKSFKLAGAIIEKKSGPSTWDYSGVQQWNEAKERLAYITKLAQIGGMDESGNEVSKAVKIEGKSTISIKLIE